jgi:hypothetical protein
MHTFTYRILTILVLFSITLSPISATTDSLSAIDNNATVTESKDMTAVLNRLNEIKAMDMAALTPKERKALRKEVRDIREEVRKADTRGVYLSVGAIIIIILLLILIL